MTKPQAYISLSIFVFGCIVIPSILANNGFSDSALVVFVVSLVTFCYWPKKASRRR